MLKAAQPIDFVIGYGSLLSRHSRESYSDIQGEGLSVTVTGWQRAWVTRAEHEQQTYVGAFPAQAAQLNAQVFAASLNPELQKREQNYRFTRVNLGRLSLSKPTAQSRLQGVDEATAYPSSVIDALNINDVDARFWICESLLIQPADQHYPVNLSYVDTCLLGCYEQLGVHGVEDFVMLSSHWPKQGVNNDRNAALYPRRSEATGAQTKIFDSVLRKKGYLD